MRAHRRRPNACRAVAVLCCVVTGESREKTLQVYRRGTYNRVARWRWRAVRDVAAAVGRPGDTGQVNQVFRCACVCATCITAAASLPPTSETGFPPPYHCDTDAATTTDPSVRPRPALTTVTSSGSSSPPTTSDIVVVRVGSYTYNVVGTESVRPSE